MRTRLAAILVVLLMVGWPLTIAGSAGAATAENPALSGSTVEANFIEEGDDQFTNVSDDLIVWERSFKPLRADTTASSAKTVIENHAINVVDNRSGVFDDTTANRPETAIFDKSGTIPIEFSDVSGASTDAFDNRSAQVIVASFEENQNTADVGSADQLNDVISPALDGDLSALRTEAADRNVEFTVENTSLDENGELDYDLEPDTAGPYVVMVALPRDAGESGFDTDENNLLTLPGEATLMGVETVLVHDSESQINAPNTVEPGEEIELNPSTELEGDITHSVVVYNEETFLDEDQETNIRLDEDISRSLTTEDIVLEHSIAEVNGVGEMTNSGTIFGTSVSQRTIAGTVALADIIDQLSTETDVGINRESISPETTIDASGVVKSDAGASTEMTVQTYGNWSEGTYRIVHIAENGTVGGVATSTQTIDISESSGGSSDDDDDDDDDDGDDGDDGDADVTVTERDRGASVSVQNIRQNTPTRVGVGRNVTSGGATVRNFTVNLTRDRDTFDLEVTTSDQPPEGVPVPPGRNTLSYIDVNAGNLTDDDYNGVEWEFTVDQDRLDELNRSPDSVELNRYNVTSGEWESFETTHLGGDEFTATVPGFSTFAITSTDDGSDAPDSDGPDNTDDDSTTDDGAADDSAADDSTTDDSATDDSTGGDDADAPDGDDDDSPVGIAVILLVLAVLIAVAIGVYQSQQD